MLFLLFGCLCVCLSYGPWKVDRQVDSPFVIRLVGSDKDGTRREHGAMARVDSMVQELRRYIRSGGFKEHLATNGNRHQLQLVKIIKMRCRSFGLRARLLEIPGPLAMSTVVLKLLAPAPSRDIAKANCRAALQQEFRHIHKVVRLAEGWTLHVIRQTRR